MTSTCHQTPLFLAFFLPCPIFLPLLSLTQPRLLEPTLTAYSPHTTLLMLTPMATHAPTYFVTLHPRDFRRLPPICPSISQRPLFQIHSSHALPYTRLGRLSFLAHSTIHLKCLIWPRFCQILWSNSMTTTRCLTPILFPTRRDYKQQSPWATYNSRSEFLSMFV